MTARSKPYTIALPPEAEQIDEMFDILFSDLRSGIIALTPNQVTGGGVTAYAPGDLLVGSGTNILSSVAIGGVGSVLRSNGTTPTWSTLTIPNTAVLGDVLYASAANVLTALAGNITTTQKFLAQTGSGAVSAAPTWVDLALTFVPYTGATANINTGAFGITTASLAAVGLVSATINSIASTSTDGMLLANNTLSTAGADRQISPRLRFRSHTWNLTAVAADNTHDWWIEGYPESAATPYGTMRFVSSLNGAAATVPLILDSRPNGVSTFLSDVRVTGDLTVSAASRMQFLNRGGFAASGNGLFLFRLQDTVTGFGLDVVTDAVMKVRTRAHTGYATVDALAYRINGGAGAVGSADKIQKSVAAIADATLTTILTITIPNAAHSATIRVSQVGSIGAGGAIGANEASASNSYYVTVTRTAGVNATAAISAAFGAAATAVAGATTVTSVVTLAAVVGAVGASNTIPIQVTITKAGGASANHTCQVISEVLNANATGITVA